MSYKNIREQIKTIISSVENVGNVIEYIPWTKNTDDLKKAFLYIPPGKSKGQIRGWSFTRESVPEAWFGGDMNQRTHEIRVHGYLQFEDEGANELEFQDLVDSVCDALRPKFDLNDTADVSEAIQVETIEHVMFVGVLCHHTELTFAVHEVPTYTTS